MISLGSIFIQTAPVYVLQRTIQVMNQDQEVFGKFTFDDISINAGVLGAKSILDHISQTGAYDDVHTFRSQIEKAQKYLKIAESEGNSASLSLLAPLAETYLAAMYWILDERPNAIALLSSAYQKSSAVARSYPSKFINVNEEEKVQINGSANYMRWSYQGVRPEPGSPSRLAQDIEFALHTAKTGSFPLPTIFEKWEPIVDSGVATQTP